MLQAIFSTLTALLMALAALTPAQTNGQARPEAKPAANPARDSVIRIVEQIKRADYEATGLRSNVFMANSRPCLTTECSPPAGYIGEALPSGAGQSTALTSPLLPKTWRKT